MDNVLVNNDITVEDLINNGISEEEYCSSMNKLKNIVNIFEMFGVLEKGDMFTPNTAEWFRFKMSLAIECIDSYNGKELFKLFNEWMRKLRDTVKK